MTVLILIFAALAAQPVPCRLTTRLALPLPPLEKGFQGPIERVGFFLVR